jgi:hypothetical protein
LTALFAIPHSKAIILAYGMANASHVHGDWRQREMAQRSEVSGVSN